MKAYHLVSERNRNIIISASKLEDLRRARNLLNKIDKDFRKRTKIKSSAINFEIVECEESNG
tara:strand:+ start:300 stop:485 length:186 start_codon:yes stop_codon:yes gene_type:complete